tara:strand:- start:1184 stop:2302 length:1119 start_codon:yes stop_codon:yes gene_type:complete
MTPAKAADKSIAMSLFPETSSIQIQKASKPRSLDSFLHLTQPEFVGAAPTPGQIIALNKPNDRNHSRDAGGLFIKQEDLIKCAWKASADDLEPGSFIQPYNQKFGGNDKPNAGILFTKPRFQIVFETAGLLEKNVVDEKTGANKAVIIGSFNPADNQSDPGRVNMLWDLYNENKKDHTIRTWYYVYFMSGYGQRCHDLPLILSIKGAVGASFRDQLKAFRDDVSSALAAATKTPKRPANYDAFAQYIFQPHLELKDVGQGNNQSTAVTAFDYERPLYDQGQEAAKVSLDSHIIPDDLMKRTKEERQDEYAIGMMSRYTDGNSFINIADGVQITPLGIMPPMMPESFNNALESSIPDKMLAPVRDSHGADAKF